MLDAATLAAMSTATPPAGSDSLHRLVMDLHKQLNALQAGLAEETIDGAAAYGLADEDRPRVAAFMAGLNRTARLKFDHPGLGTTATRCGDKLVLQNDIGTTDAHVVVIHVEALTIRVTYTDVHERAAALLPGHAGGASRRSGRPRGRDRSPAAPPSTSPPAASTRRTRRRCTTRCNSSAPAWCS